MRYSGLPELLKLKDPALSKGPIALIFIEDEVEIASTLRHHLDLGFRAVIVFAEAHIQIDPDLEQHVRRVDLNMNADNVVPATVNSFAAARPGAWLYYCYNAEYLYFPFCESRSVGEMLTYTTEERRESVLCYVVDLYANDLEAHPSAVSLSDAHLDRTGYYALAREDDAGHPMDRQMNFYGGLRWRFEEHIPVTRRRIDRIALFRAKPGVTLLPTHRFTEQEYNTFSCPWHNNLTAAICSFRVAKALCRNPGSRFDIHSFSWRGTERFEWNSTQLLDLGLMEPGQWF